MTIYRVCSTDNCFLEEWIDQTSIQQAISERKKKMMNSIHKRDKDKYLLVSLKNIATDFFFQFGILKIRLTSYFCTVNSLLSFEEK